MRYFNCRFLCSPRKVLKFIILGIAVSLMVSFMIIFPNEKRATSRAQMTIPRSRDQNIHTKLRTKIPCPEKLRLLILVSSNLGHSDRRMLIRKTWGPDNSLRMRWRTVFLLTENNNPREKKIAEVESDLYGDIITGEYQESFFNMAFKVAMGFEWALKFCKFDFLLKVDDDIFVNTHGVLDYLDSKTTLKEKLYTGNPMVGSPVLRKGRYAVKYVSNEKRDDATNLTMFVPYSSGGGILLSSDVVSSVLDLYDLVHPLNIDDAYIGELVSRAGVKLLINHKNFLMYAVNCKYNPQAFVQHPAKGQCLEELHRQHVKYLLTGVLETPKPTTRPPTKAPAKAQPIPNKNTPIFAKKTPPPIQPAAKQVPTPIPKKNLVNTVVKTPPPTARPPMKPPGKVTEAPKKNPVDVAPKPPTPTPPPNAGPPMKQPGKVTAAPNKNPVAVAPKPPTPTPRPTAGPTMKQP